MLERERLKSLPWQWWTLSSWWNHSLSELITVSIYLIVFLFRRRPHPPPFPPHLPAVCLGCFSKWHPGLWPWSLGCDHWKTSGEGLSGAAPSRGPQGPPSAAATEDFSAALARRPCRGAAPAEVPPRLRAVAVPGGQAACAPGPGASEPRASPAPSGTRHCGSARAAARGAPTAGGRLARRQARAAATSGKAYKWANDTLAQLSICLRGCLDDSSFLCNPITWLGTAWLLVYSITCPPTLASQAPLHFGRKGQAGGWKGREGGRQGVAGRVLFHFQG